MEFKRKLMTEDSSKPAKRAKADAGTSDASEGTAGTEGKSNDPPVGSWTCSACGNINWPQRTMCNRKNCGLPRIQVCEGVHYGVAWRSLVICRCVVWRRGRRSGLCSVCD